MVTRKPKVVKDNAERWLLTYSDLITLLLIFFIILYSMSSTDVRKFENLTGALQHAFNNGSFQLVTIGGSPGNVGTGTTAPKSTAAPTSTKELMQQVQSELSKLLKVVGQAQSVVSVGMSHEGVVITLNGSLLFYPGDIALKPESRPVLTQIATLLATMPQNVRVEGNTDNVPSPTVSNWDLSALRAVNIVEYLASNGVSATRLQAEGLGQFHPVATNSTPEGRAKNRRADIVILNPS
jgi:chemotaxis protein MotB